MNNQQTFNRLAPSFFFQQDPATIGATTTLFPPLDLGTIEERTNKVDAKQETILDDREGITVPISVKNNAFIQTWELTTPNTSLDIIAMFYRSLPPTAPSPAIPGGTITAAPHSAYPGSPVLLVDGNGNRQMMVSAITSVMAGSTALVKGVDYGYTAGDLDRGIIYILPGSTVVTTSPTALTITYVTAAVTGAVQITPLSGPCIVQGYGEIHLASCDGARRIKDFGRYNITVDEITLNNEKDARVKPTVTKIVDPTGVTPNGVIAYKGYPTP